MARLNPDDDKLAFETSEDCTVRPHSAFRDGTRFCPQVIKSFESMGLNEALVRGIYAYGFERPSAVQQRAIVPILKGRDVIVQSQSGTGKTCVFCLGALQALKIGKGERDPQVGQS